MTGPVQVLVVGFDQPSFSGQVLEELGRLESAGVVRLVDLLVVVRDDDGVLETVSLPGNTASGLGVVAAALLADGDDAPGGDAESTWSLADVVPPGSAAAIALVEHLWAGPLVAAIQRAGGRPLEETWLGPDERRALEQLLEGRHSAPA
ncbi:MAG TPA: DUF6325 family protein [Kineosporiaceae bacterium]|nr:DUF6325 family protein [Kineosporiaceae bacterium]